MKLSFFLCALFFSCTLYASLPTPFCEGLLQDLSYQRNLNDSEIKDQCEGNTCWAYSYVSGVEQTLVEDGDAPDSFSMPYFLIQSFKWEALMDIATSRNPGTSFQNFDFDGIESWGPSIVKKFGALPEGIWSPKIPISGWPWETIKSELNNSIEKWKQVFLKAEPAPGENPMAVSDRILKEAQEDISARLGKLLGTPPETFQWKGRETTPIEFSQLYSNAFFENSTVMIHVVHDRDSSDKTRSGQPYIINSLTGKPTNRSLESENASKPPRKSGRVMDAMSRELHLMSDDGLKSQIIRQINAGKSVGIGFWWAEEFINRKTGLMYYDGDTSADLTKLEFHIARVVGYGRDKNGELVLRIHNSHGTKVGQHGYFHMHESYFRKFTDEAFVSRLY